MKYSKAISMIEKGMIFTDELKDTCLSALRFAEKHKSKMVIPSKAYIVVPGALLYGWIRKSRTAGEAGERGRFQKL